MKRIAFTIIYEGRHHLEHKEFAEKMASMFDRWIVIEGYSLPFGSTRWCNMLQVPAVSQDGTVEFMKEFALSHKNVHFYSKGGYYNSKDQQVNAAIQLLQNLADECFLWEVDADEHWKEEDLTKAETIAMSLPDIGFKFQFNHYVGPGIVAVGEWGSGYLNRLWKWSGQLFTSHEPAMLKGQTTTAAIDGVKFDHYSYYFKKDAQFKSRSYPDHEMVYENYDKIQPPNEYPLHISKLFGEKSKIGKTNTLIVQV